MVAQQWEALRCEFERSNVVLVALCDAMLRARLRGGRLSHESRKTLCDEADKKLEICYARTAYKKLGRAPRSERRISCRERNRFKGEIRNEFRIDHFIHRR